MKKTVIEYVTGSFDEDIPRHILQENKIRLNAFFLEQETIQKKEMQLVLKYALYSVESPRKATRQGLLKEYEALPPDLRSIPVEQIQAMAYKDIVLYGDETSPEAQEQLSEYLKRNNRLKVQLSFFDGTSDHKPDIAYAELQKALFFCKRKKCPLLFISIRDMIQDIRFFSLLEESRVDFRCIDFPWFCLENLNLIKAVVLYEKLRVETNVK